MKITTSIKIFYMVSLDIEVKNHKNISLMVSYFNAKPIKIIIKLLVLSWFILLLNFPLVSQVVDSEEVKESPVLKITDPITLDGKLEEFVWKNAPEAKSLLYRQSERTDPSQVETSVKILYGASNMYIGFSCFDSNPSLIRGEMTIRDGDLRTDDSVYVLLESMYDRKYYYLFGTNIRGARLDAKISPDGSIIDPKWEGAWNSAATLTDSGWTVEISIDLKEFKYEEDVDKSMGISISRVVPRLDTLLWSGPLDPIFNLDEPQLIKRIDLIARRQAWSLNAYVLPGFKTDEKMGLKGGGLDTTYSPHKNFSGSLTLNPDFATVEPIDEKINLTMFELDLQDKRPFFFRDTHPFDPNFSLFYPRRIDDIYGGLKFQGKSGALEFSGITTQTKKESEIHSANFSYLKMNTRLIKSFSISIAASNKLLDNQNKGGAAVSMNWDLTRQIKLAGQFFLSYGDYSEDNTASLIKLHFDLPAFYLHLGLKRIEEHFWENANQVGYILDDDRQEIEVSLNKLFSFNHLGMETIEYDSYYDIYWSIEGTLRSWQIDQSLTLHFQNFWKLSVLHTRDYKFNTLFPEGVVEPGEGMDFKDWEEYKFSLGPLPYFDPDYVFNLLNPVVGRKYKLYVGSREYHNKLTKVTSGYYKGKGNTFYLSLGMGRFFAQSYEYYEAYKDFIVSKKFFMGIRANWVKYKYNIPPAYNSTRIYILEGTYDIDRNRTLRIFFQHNSKAHKFNLYLNYQWKIIPSGGILHLVYQRGLSGFGEQGLNRQAIYTKFIYSF